VTGQNRRFNPNNRLSRAQFALVLYRLDGSPDVSGDSVFSDVDQSGIAYNAISWAHTNRIVTGEAGKFNPNSNITRAQMVLMLHRYNEMYNRNSLSDSDALDRFSDKNRVSPTAGEAMRWGVTHRLITGGGNVLNPNGYITRAQAVLILHRYVHSFEF